MMEVNNMHIHALYTIYLEKGFLFKIMIQLQKTQENCLFFRRKLEIKIALSVIE